MTLSSSNSDLSPWAADYVPGDIVDTIPEEKVEVYYLESTTDLETVLRTLGLLEEVVEDEANFDDLPQELQDEIDAMLGGDLECDGTESDLNELVAFYTMIYPKGANTPDDLTD